MPPGPNPKDPSLRARRNKTTTRAVLPSERNGDIPPLPEHIEWFEVVEQWWKDTWSKAPQVDQWDESAVHVLYLAAMLYQQFWDPETKATTRVSTANEIRQLLAQFGLTPMAMRSLQWETDRGEEAAERTAQRRAGKAAPAKKAEPRPDPRVARANLHAV